MGSTFLIEYLPTRVLIWLKFGTELFLDNLVLLVLIPLLVNIVFILKSNFHFGFRQIKFFKLINREKESSNLTFSINTDELKDYYRFAFAYSRNPYIFKENKNIEKIFKSLDDKISNLPNNYQNNEALKSSESKNSNYLIKENSKSKYTNNDISISTADTTDDNSIGIEKKHNFLNNFLKYFNLAVISIIIIANCIGFFKYNTLVNDYFDNTEKGYKLNNNIKGINDIERTRLIFKVDDYIERINDIKYPKQNRNIK